VKDEWEQEVVNDIAMPRAEHCHDPCNFDSCLIDAAMIQLSRIPVAMGVATSSDLTCSIDRTATRQSGPHRADAFACERHGQTIDEVCV
jgi:hypothetical protein